MPGPTDGYIYNQLACSNESLVSGMHTLSISSDGSRNSVIEFDYAIYSYVLDIIAVSLSLPLCCGSTDIKPPTHTDIGAIIGSAIGGIAALAIVVTYLFYRSRKGSIPGLPSPNQYGSHEKAVNSLISNDSSSVPRLQLYSECKDPPPDVLEDLKSVLGIDVLKLEGSIQKLLSTSDGENAALTLTGKTAENFLDILQKACISFYPYDNGDLMLASIIRS
jgi:hypothetical protein